jgi:hypothetical protein
MANPNAKGNYSYTPGDAREAMYATFWNTWDDSLLGWRAVLPGVMPDDPLLAPTVAWDAEEPEDDAAITAPVVYAYVRHTTGKQASLSARQDPTTEQWIGRRWQRTGFILLRLDVPQSMQLKTGDALAKVIVNAFQGKRGVGSGAGIIFPSVRPIEQGNLKSRYRIDINVSFQYDELV